MISAGTLHSSSPGSKSRAAYTTRPQPGMGLCARMSPSKPVAPKSFTHWTSFSSASVRSNGTSFCCCRLRARTAIAAATAAATVAAAATAAAVAARRVRAPTCRGRCRRRPRKPEVRRLAAPQWTATTARATQLPRVAACEGCQGGADAVTAGTAGRGDRSEGGGAADRAQSCVAKASRCPDMRFLSRLLNGRSRRWRLET
mmetsp:Transcript_44406/g.142325  ORF Transcript_44406/g.142325 Transcript_44406/m.142325 type:complete len:201 (+) Transcript_44406:1204-1806(+)